VHQEWTDQLSDYLDGELSAETHRDVETHLRSCASCAAVLEDLKRIVARAASAEPRPPHADLWAGIAERIDAGAPASARSVVPFARRETRRVAFTMPQLAAAAALLIAVSGGTAWQLATRAGRPEGLHYTTDASRADLQVRPDGARLQVRPEVPASPGNGAADFARVETVGMADAQYDAAVADLEKALKAGRGHLDASTIAIVEHNLQIIDQAINQAREALVSDPANSYLSGHLVEARRRKLDLLRRATALATETD
jgi:anti-sigma factor RsiW